MSHIRLPLKASGLTQDSKSVGLISKSGGTNRAVVFVHGFGGGAIKTWKNLHGLVEDGTETALDDADLYFIDYASFSTSIRVLAEDLLDLLRKIVPRPPEQLFQYGDYNVLAEYPRVSGEYSELVLVGHSLGGVVVRQAIRLALRDLLRGTSRVELAEALNQRAFERALSQANLKLLAPALGGFYPKGPMALGRQFGVTSLVQWSRTYQELQTDSPILRDLRSETEQFAKVHESVASLRAELRWAEFDDIVSDSEYDCDRTGVLVRGVGHSSICKSSRTYSVVVELLARGEVLEGAS